MRSLTAVVAPRIDAIIVISFDPLDPSDALFRAEAQ
jgi:hypothetical protein